MKLLELTRSYYPSVGGLERSVKDKTKVYEELGIEYKIITTTVSSRILQGVKNPQVIYLDQFTPYNITPNLYKHLKDGYDVVNINLLGRFYSDYAIKHYYPTNTKIILTPHSFYHTRKYDAIKGFLEYFIFPKIIDKIDAMVVFTNNEKDTWIDRYNIDPNKIFVIPHYIETIQNNAIEQVGDKEDKYIVYIGSNNPNKQINLLLKTFCSIKDIGYSLYLTISNENITLELKNIVKKNRRIKLLGFVTDEHKSQLLTNASAVIYPTSYEAFGYGAFEASQYSKPLLCSELPVFRELLNNQGTIFFENNEESLGIALSKFAKMSDKEKAIMGDLNKDNISKYNYVNNVKEYKKLFEYVLHTNK